MPTLIDDERVTRTDERFNLIANLVAATDSFVKDPHIGYHLSKAFDSFTLKFYESVVVYSGLSIEEALAKVYSEVTAANPAVRRINRRTRSPCTVNEMSFSTLIAWAKGANVGLILPSWGRETIIVDEIREARNFFAHSQRGISNRIKQLLTSGYFVDILPTFPPGSSLASTAPVLGQLFTQETALAILNSTVSILQRIDAYLKLRSSSL